MNPPVHKALWSNWDKALCKANKKSARALNPPAWFIRTYCNKAVTCLACLAKMKKGDDL